MRFKFQEYQEDILGGLSVLVNDNNLDNTQVQQLVLNDELLNTLTAVTLPDGTQAFVAENPSPSGNHALLMQKKGKEKMSTNLLVYFF